MNHALVRIGGVVWMSLVVLGYGLAVAGVVA